MNGWTRDYVSAPAFVADWEAVARNTGRQIDWSYVPESYRGGNSYTITTTGIAAAAATSIPVEALPVALPTGTTLDFTGAGELAVLTAPAAAGATTLTVEALDAQIESGDTATYRDPLTGAAKVIPAGTVMCQLASGKVVPRAAQPGAEEAIGLLMSSARENSQVAALSGYGIVVGGVIYENLLPEFGDAGFATFQTELATNGHAWVWETYADDSEV